MVEIPYIGVRPFPFSKVQVAAIFAIATPGAMLCVGPTSEAAGFLAGFCNLSHRKWHDP